MTLEEFDAKMGVARSCRTEAEYLIEFAEKTEHAALAAAGVEWVPREPGFPCWRHKDRHGWYWTLREALEAAQAAKVVG